MKKKTPPTPIVENAFDQKLIEGFKKVDPDALKPIFFYYRTPIEAMLKKTMDNEEEINRVIAKIFFETLLRMEKISKTEDLQTIIFIKARKACSMFLKGEPLEQMNQQLNDLKAVFYEIECLQENDRTIIKTCLQNEERAAAAKQLKKNLPSLSKLVKKAINVLVAKLHKKRKIKSLDIFNDIFLPFLLKKN